MNDVKITLGKSQAADLDSLFRLGKDVLQACLVALKNLDSKFAFPAKILKTISTELELNDARNLTKQLVALTHFARKNHLHPEELIESLDYGIQNFNWEKGVPADWEICRSVFLELFSLDTISLSNKALDLSFDYSNLLVESRILTDARPVFNEDHSKIVGAIIAQSLRIQYSDNDGTQDVTISLDIDDIEDLRDSCVEALKKSKVVNDLITDKCDIETFVAGEETYDFE